MPTSNSGASGALDEPDLDGIVFAGYPLVTDRLTSAAGRLDATTSGQTFDNACLARIRHRSDPPSLAL